MDLRLVVKPDLDFEWHRWFAWHPVFIKDEESGQAMWVWLETVERILADGMEGLEAYYRLPR